MTGSFFDNHANCDSSAYSEHERKVANFFRSGEIGSIIRENMEDESSLEEFAGDNWNQAIIPIQRQEYPKAFSVAHYENIEFA